MEESLTTRLDEVEQELVGKLSLRSDDLQLFTARQDQLLQSHYHSMSAALKTAQAQLDRIGGIPHVEDVKEMWIERQNLKKFWLYCEEQRLALYARETGHPETKGSFYQTSSTNNTNNNSHNNLSTISLSSHTDQHELDM
jgi:hypothetical protein